MNLSENLSGNIGILGGTFNPFHLGHLALARTALEQFQLKQVLVMPNHLPGYKDTSDLIPDIHRAEMIQLALKDSKNIVFSDYELKQGGITYTVDTLRSLHQKYPRVTWFFIMGGDSILYFDKWKESAQILELSNLIIAVRGDADQTSISKKIDELRSLYHKENFFMMNLDPIDISSSDIRKRIRENRSVNGMLPSEVESYIQMHHLYQ